MSETMLVAQGDFPPTIGKVAMRELRNAGYAHLAQLPAVAARDLLALHGVGPKAIRLLREALAERGETFAESVRSNASAPICAMRARRGHCRPPICLREAAPAIVADVSAA
jgi:hypothetical protein